MAPPYYRKELARQDHTNPEAVGTREVPCVEGQQKIAPTLHC
jgi:hypothetical protein